MKPHYHIVPPTGAIKVHFTTDNLRKKSRQVHLYSTKYCTISGQVPVEAIALLPAQLATTEVKNLLIALHRPIENVEN